MEKRGVGAPPGGHDSTTLLFINEPVPPTELMSALGIVFNCILFF